MVRQDPPMLLPLAGVTLLAAGLAMSPDLLARLLRLRPIPLRRRVLIHLRHRLSR